MSAIADLISPADRQRLLKRLAEWRDLDGAMRKPGGMPAVPEAPALHKMAAGRQRRRDDGDRGRTAGQVQHQPVMPATVGRRRTR